MISKRKIDRGKISQTLYTDASTRGWGASLDGNTTGGRWSASESHYHINYLELKAVYLGLQALCKNLNQSHIKVLTDNTTAVAYIRNMGGSHSLPCNQMAREIWEWCIPRGVWITVSHIPGKDNIVADRASRIFDDSTEWKLDSNIFREVTRILGQPNIDMFASRLNCQITPYVSWFSDPNALAVDAFTIEWSNYFVYAFPPFSVLPHTLQKIEREKSLAILIAPNWPSQPWYPKLLRLLIKRPILLPPQKTNVHLPFKRDKPHPLGVKLKLMACLLSGDPLQTKAFQQQYRQRSVTPGDQIHRNNTTHTWQNGNCLQVNGVWIPFLHL